MRNFIDIVENHIINEAGAGPARIVTHIREGKPFFMISACRATCSPEVNKKRTEVLRKQLAQLPGVSFIETYGEYQEVGQDEPSQEDSFFVLPRSDNTNMKKFHAVGAKLMQAFDQDSILVGDGEDVYLDDRDGNKYSLGSIATFDPSVMKKLGGHSFINKRPFSFTNTDNAPNGIEYGIDKQIA